ncbi:hypothetical protein AA042_21765 [Pseudomonas lundensis]|uniref:hypothetical protein n=1 Tax=Pseudomonas lundensis TaxID=86185 RepID=UPI00064213F1|nr:hypothetical protein [Pseudomonas lundensis]AOZ14978.1 hypothetical protein AA042_21765 [Pseudomonas lundensis]QVQ77736.1 hypothetical protein KIN24_01070 [Pseudomonas lundensis]QVQ83195.1 hypothetical protein KIY13_08375 [Pseudomonas lundensis]
MTDFLDTVEGPDWLHDAINTLICGDNVAAPRPFGKSVALVTPQSLYEALAEHLGAQEQIAPLLTDNREYPIERMICEIVAGGRRVYGTAYDLACSALGTPKVKHHPTALHDVAEALIRPWANDYGRARAEELAADAAADRFEQRKADAA